MNEFIRSLIWDFNWAQLRVFLIFSGSELKEVK